MEAYLRGKDASHIRPYSKVSVSMRRNTGNLAGFEDMRLNRARRDAVMTKQELQQLRITQRNDNFKGAAKVRRNMAVGAAAGAAVFEGMFSAAEHMVGYAKGDKSGEKAIVETGVAAAQAAGSAAAVTYVVGTVAAASPAIAAGIAVAAPALAVYGVYSVAKRAFKLGQYAAS